MLKEFKEFALKGNIMDMAVGVVIGGAFQKIVNSLVQDVIMPGVSILTGKVDFSDMVWQVGNASIKYGNFITTIVDFLIIAFSIFLVVSVPPVLWPYRSFPILPVRWRRACRSFRIPLPTSIGFHFGVQSVSPLR